MALHELRSQVVSGLPQHESETKAKEELTQSARGRTTGELSRTRPFPAPWVHAPMVEHRAMRDRSDLTWLTVLGRTGSRFNWTRAPRALSPS